MRTARCQRAGWGKMLGTLLALCTALSSAAHAALVTIENPTPGAVETGSAISLQVTLAPEADPGTLSVALNGIPITDRLSSAGFQRTAILAGVPGRHGAPRRGLNFLQVSVAGSGGTTDSQRVRFRWRPRVQRVHVIVVGNKLDFAAYESFATWQAEVDRIFRDLVRPRLRKRVPNLVVLTEDFGLPAALIGSRGAAARAARDADPLTALTNLFITYGAQAGYYSANFTLPGTGLQPLARALELALTDTLTRAFLPPLAAAARAHGVYLVACTNVAPSVLSTDAADVSFFGDIDNPARTDVYLPVGIDTYNTAFFWGPDGELIGTTRKVNLTAPEIDLLNLSNGALEDVQAFDTPIGRIGIAISLDAFIPDYVQRLNDLGAVLVVQPDANPGQWANAVGEPNPDSWQPDEWLDSIMGMLADEYPNIYYNATSMMTGGFFPGVLDASGNPTGIVFDGQSTITRRAHRPPRRDFVATLPGDAIRLFGTKPLIGEFVALSPWAFPDPGTLATPRALDDLLAQCGSSVPRGSDPQTLSLADRQRILIECADTLMPGGRNAGAYRESVIAADLRPPVARNP